jgi:PAS domain S-box-containing protein
MKMNRKTKQELLVEMEGLRWRLTEAEETLRAIRNGEVDALVIQHPESDRVYTLKGADHTYRVLIETMNEGALTVSSAGTILYCNSRFGEMLQTPLEKVIGSSLTDFILSEEQSLVETFLQQRIKESAKSEIHLRVGDGTLLPVAFSIRSLGLKEFQGGCAVVTDLTAQEERQMKLDVLNENLKREIEEHTQAEQALRESEERFALFMKHFPGPAYIKDEQGKLLYINEYLEKLYHCNVEEVLGKADFDLWPKDTAANNAQNDQRVLSSGKVLQCTNEVLVDGEPIIYMSNEFPIPRKGRSSMLGGVSVDITRQKQAEDKLKEYTRKLEWSNRELQDFAFMASHDMQEPLRKIQTFGGRLKEKYGERLGDVGRDYLERMESAAMRMQSLIRALLIYSRVTTQAQPFTRVDLAALVREVVDNLRTVLDQTGGRMEVGELAVIEADENQLYQLFQNLIGNALKFHGEEKPVVKVHGRLINGRQGKGKSAQNVWYEILVEDNGIGFDGKYADRIFIPFQTLHGRGTYEGTGIGLAICRKVVEHHGGRITAQSIPGKGSTFIITLPVTPLSKGVYDENS